MNRASTGNDGEKGSGFSHALAGRLPVLFRDRIYTSYGSFLLTFAAISAASYSYLVGTALIGVGNTRLGIFGYLIGLVLGMAFVSLAGGALSYRYGVDTVDAGKASLGMRGTFALLIGVLICTLGWSYVLLAMTARAAIRLLHGGRPTAGMTGETEVILLSLLLLILIWLLLRRGATSMERVANYCGAAQLGVALILIAAILHRFGPLNAWRTDVPSAQAYSTDRVMQVAYAVEFGICNALGLLPYMGGLTRLVRYPRHLVGPPILGYAVCGAAFIATVGALATATTGQVDPAAWIMLVAGRTGGGALLGIILVANLGAMVTQVYLAGIAIQQVRAFANFAWPLVVAVVLTPGVLAAFNTRWVIDHVMNWLAYNGVMFVGLASVMFVDFLILRHRRVSVAQLFAARPGQQYWYWGGVNWVAAVVIASATILYLWLFDPMSLRAATWFRYAGAAVPTFIASSALYYSLMRCLVLPRGIGGYSPPMSDADPVEVKL
jgi:nucleobase:cation symporter-1, NCS1 family